MKNRTEPYWLSYLGSSGAGKTLLAASLWGFFYEVGSWYRRKDCDALNVHTGQFLYWPNYVDEMKRGDYSRGRDLRDDWFVVIDDIGAEHTVTANANKQLANILTARLGKWTVLTSNKSLEQIKEDMDTRIASRMLRNNSALIEVNVRDYNDRENLPVNPFENL